MVLLLSQRHDLPVADHLRDDARHKACLGNAPARIAGLIVVDDNDPPPSDSKLTRSKERWAREGRFLTGKTSRPEAQRLPPGQHLTRDWPTLDLGLTPQITRDRWWLDVYGAVENPIFWDFAQFTAQPQTKLT